MKKFKPGDEVVVVTDEYAFQQWQEGIVAARQSIGGRIIVELTKENKGAANNMYQNNKRANNYDEADLELKSVVESSLYKVLNESR